MGQAERHHGVAAAWTVSLRRDVGIGFPEVLACILTERTMIDPMAAGRTLFGGFRAGDMAHATMCCTRLDFQNDILA
ncbi:MAG: hypothetical protein ABW003_13655 [Microvirga sp.]